MVGRRLRLLPLVLLAFGALPSSTALAVPQGPLCLLSTTGSLRPQETIDRLVATDSGRLVLIVGGFNSKPGDMRFYEPLAARFPDYEVRYFGQRDGYYDTLGDVDVNAVSLCNSVRTSVRRDDLGKVHLICHSMGAFTIDHAYTHSLGADDNVVSYTALAGAHNGAFAAKAANVAARLAPSTSYLADKVIHLSGQEPAVRSLANLQPARAPRRVRTLNLRALEDPVLLGRDSHLEGAREATLHVHPLEAHGGIAQDQRALQLVEANVRGDPVQLTYEEETGNAVLRSVFDVVHGSLIVGAAMVLVGVNPTLQPVHLAWMAADRMRETLVGAK